MGYSLSTFGASLLSSGATPITITVPVNAAVGVSAMMQGGGGYGYFQGSISDTGGNAYTASGGANLGTYYYCDSFYCLNTSNSATSITYTPPANYTTLYDVFVAAWVWTVTGGTPSFGSQSNNYQSAPGAGANAVTSGSVTCGTNSVIMGWSYNSTGSPTLSAGSSFSQDYATYGGAGEHGAFNSSQAATWTSSSGTENVSTQALSFGLIPLNSTTIAWLK